MVNVTQILSQIEQGDSAAAEQLLPLVYKELRKLAAAKMAQEKPGQTLQATALVHEAYLRLVNGAEQHWDSRGHFFSAAAEAMRRILIEKARRKRRLKRDGKQSCEPLDQIEVAGDGPPFDLLEMDEALTALEIEAPKKAEIVKLRFFGGLTYAEVAAVAGVSVATAKRHWRYARVWMLRHIDENQDSRVQ